jgi:hypothetical protein
MHLSVTFLTALVIGATSVSALQHLYIGSIGGCGSNKYGPDWYVWPTNGPACTTGTDLGPTSYFGNSLCGRNITLSGSEDVITFTGCPPPATIYDNPGAPTGVSDGCSQTLKCHPVSRPDQKCPCGGVEVTVKTLYKCN